MATTTAQPRCANPFPACDVLSTCTGCVCPSGDDGYDCVTRTRYKRGAAAHGESTTDVVFVGACAMHGGTMCNIAMPADKYICPDDDESTGSTSVNLAVE